MNDREALLRTILLNPADDTPRLVYADWLEENGEVKLAEFIRVQCRIAELLAVTERWAKTPSDRPGGTREDGGAAGEALADAQRLQRREWELSYGLCFRSKVFAQLMPESEYHSVAVSPATPGLLNYDHRGEASRVTLAFARGFVDEIRLPLTAFLAHAESLFSAQPITAVRLTDREPNLIPGNEGIGYRDRWAWFHDARRTWVGEPNRIPVSLFDLAERSGLGTMAGTYHKDREGRYSDWWHLSPTDAHSALSTVAVTYGRQLARLSPAPAEAT